MLAEGVDRLLRKAGVATEGLRPGVERHDLVAFGS